MESDSKIGRDNLRMIDEKEPIYDVIGYQDRYWLYENVWSEGTDLSVWSKWFKMEKDSMIIWDNMRMGDHKDPI